MTKTEKLNLAIKFFNKNFALILLIIAIFVLVISISSSWIKTNQQKANSKTSNNQAQNTKPQEKPENVPPITELDHLLGAENPKVTIINYSDFNCSFCARFSSTLQKLVENYPNDVAIVYRNFLLGGVSSVSGQAAKIGECIALDRGNEAYWQYNTEIFTQANANTRLTTKDEYIELAIKQGFDRAQLKSCMDTQEITQILNDQMAGAKAVGVLGTPASVLISSKGQYEFIAGALPYESLEKVVLEYLD
jgi:protein-disulfide isomerase